VSAEHALITQDFDRNVNVFGYDEQPGATPICRTVTGVVAYDHPETGETFMLILHQAILVPKMRVNLLSPMQLRDNGIRVNDEPKHMVPNPTDEVHAITISLGNADEKLIIPLAYRGVTSYFPTRRPTAEEYENSDLSHRFELTAEDHEWDPDTKQFELQEAAMLDSNGRLKDETVPDGNSRRILASFHSSTNKSSANVEPEVDFGLALEYWRKVGPTRTSRSLKAFRSGERSPNIDPRVLAKRWGISLESAKKTLKATTQKGVRTILHPHFARRFRTNDRQLRYRRLPVEMFTDTLESSRVSWYRRNKYAQVFATRNGWVRAFPMRKKSDAHEGFSLMAQRDGIPTAIIADGSKEQTLGQFRKKCKEAGVRFKQTEPYSPWQNAAEGNIRELKRGAGRKMLKKRSPAALWDHCIELESYIRSNTAIDNYELQGQVAETVVSGQTADISPFIEHGWYDWVKWWDTQSKYPAPREVLGRWLGPAIDVGPAMTSKILLESGYVVYRSTVRGLNDDEVASPEEQKMREEFDTKIHRKLGKPPSPSDLKSIDPDILTPEYQLYDDDFEEHSRIPDVEDATPEDLDQYVGAEVTLPLRGTQRAGKVKKRVRDAMNEPMGVQNDNPILDTRVYEVEFPDGSVGEYSANIIAENMYSQCDPYGNQYLLMDAIVDHKTSAKAVKFADRFVTVNGRQHHRKTTAGWKLCILWKDGSTSWERLADVKESYPIEIAEYAMAQGIDHEPAFAWWTSYVLKKRDRIIAAVNSRYHKRTHKFGFEIPKTIQRAKEIDRENGNRLWQDAIAKEMKNVKIAFKPIELGEDVPVGHQFMECHMVFDVKLDGTRKARLVAGGHMTEAPAVMTYASVVSRDTVRIALTIAALNDLEVKTSDIQNAFLTAPCEERIWTTMDPDLFGAEYKGRKALIVRALYGLKSAAASFGNHIADCMRSLGYTSCKADADLWYKPMVRPSDGLRYYAYILLYVDDCLCIHHDPEGALRELDKYFQMKPGSIGDPDIYLGGKLRRTQLENGVHAWAMSASKYVQESVKNVETYLGKHFGGRKLPRRARAPWPNDYKIELDESPALSTELASYYQSQVGILHWTVELGRVDMITEVSLLASQMALPREGHLEALFHVFGYLKNKHNARMVYDPTYPKIDYSKFKDGQECT